jgi:hypothetical protein
MSKQIIFRINNNGDVTLDKVEGYGSGCIEATKAIERALGKSDESSRRTTEEYEESLVLEETESISL